MYHYSLLLLHLIAATIWVGGHLFLVFRYLPIALKNRDVSILKDFKIKFEPIGIPALLVLIITGILMAYDYGVTITMWFSFSTPIEKVISIKLLLLFITLVFGLTADLFVFPKLTSKTINLVTFLIITVTVTGVAMLVLGSLVRIGGV